MCFKSFFTRSCRVTQFLSNDTLGSLPQFLLNMTTRKYSINTYQTNNESRMPRTLMPRMVSCKPCPKWRKQWMKPEKSYSFFNEKNPKPDTNVMDKLQNLDMEQINKRYESMRESRIIENQRYMPHRTDILGPDIAALHFFTYRNAAVRLKGCDDWIAGCLAMLTEVLPHRYEEGYYVEAIDCSTFCDGIRYEGLENLTGLDHLKWLSLRNQDRIDAWCLDRIAGLTGQTLEYLDISSCKLNSSCMIALSRMPMLATLIVRDPGDDTETQAALSYMEYKLPHCIIKAVNENYELVCKDTDLD